MKLKNISLMSIFMCFCVIAIHLTSCLVELADSNNNWYIWSFSFNYFLRFAVPCFVFLSGYKLYRKYRNEKIDLKKYYLGRIKKIVIPFIICFAIYFLYFYSKGWITLAELGRIFITGEIGSHFYYVIFAIQLYAIFPIIIKLFEKNPNLVLIISILITAIVKQIICYGFDYLLFVSWIVYFVFGMYVAKFEKEKVNIKALIFEAIGFICFSILFVFAKYNIEVLKNSFEYYPSIYIIYSIFSTVLFLNIFKLISRKESKVQNAIINFFEPNTYYIFLYHVIFISITQFDIVIFYENPIKTLFLWEVAVTLGLSIIMCLGLNLGRKLLKEAPKK